MALVFIAIDPDTTGDHCPAVFAEEETGDFLFQGWTVTDPQILAEVAQHSPIAGNESVVLPRRRGLELCLPLNDYWVFDGRLVRFHFFSGTGEIVEDELAEDPSIVKSCAQAFEVAWERAVPHDLYRPV